MLPLDPCTPLSLTSRREECQLTAMSKPRVYPKDDTAPDRTHQQALTEVPNKHGNWLLLRCSCQLSSTQKNARKKSEHWRKSHISTHTFEIPVISSEERQDKPFIRVLYCIPDDCTDLIPCKCLRPPPTLETEESSFCPFIMLPSLTCKRTECYPDVSFCSRPDILKLLII